MQKGDLACDPRGLILEAYRIEGIDSSQCRTVFMDWALGVPDGDNALDHIQILLTYYGPSNVDHPMTKVLREGTSRTATPRRRKRR